MTDGPNLKAIRLGGARRASRELIVVRLTTDDGKEQELSLTLATAASFAGRIVNALAASPPTDK